MSREVSSRWSWLCSLAGWLLASGVALSAQQPVTPSPRSITLYVNVTDKAGNQLTGLTQQDFSLLDNKQNQAITSFRAIPGGSNETPVEAILVVDEVNDSFTNVAFERAQLNKLLQQNDGKLPLPTSLVFLTDRGAAKTNPSRDGKLLIQSLADNPDPQRSIRRSSGFYGAVERMQLSIHALGQIADLEAKTPGRKLLIWISPGWPLMSGARVELTSKNEEQIFGNIVALSASLRAAGITLYSVDPLGMADPVVRVNYYQEFVKGVKQASRAQFGNLGLQVLATQSGGLVLTSSNDVTSEISTCLADATSFYILTFDGEEADGPNDYHALELKVSRPGAIARTRTGYYAQPETGTQPSKR